MHLINTMKVLVVLSLVAVSMAAPSKRQIDHGYYPVPSYKAPAQYSFDYGVKDNLGNDFGHRESRDGYNTQGSYSVLLPDGRLQTVTYTVSGDSGYVAHVSYQGVAHHPTYSPTYRPAPAYESVPAYSPAYSPASAYSLAYEPVPVYSSVPVYG